MSVGPAAAPAGARPGPGSPRAWWASRTLRTRLVAGMLALLVLTCAVVGVTTTLALRGFLLQRLDAQLPDLVGPVTGGLMRQGGPADAVAGAAGGPRNGHDHDDGGGPFDLRSSANGEPFGTLGALLDGGRVTTATLVRVPEGGGAPELVRPDLPASAARALAAVPVSPSPGPGPGPGPGPMMTVDLSLDDVGSFRAVAAPGQGGATVVAALPTNGVDATTGRLMTIELVVFAVAVVLAGLAGALFVRSSLRPLRRVAATATAVAATPMGSGAVTMPRGVTDTDQRTEVGQVGAAFNAMLGQVGASLAERQATEERLRQFVADASHELRTPLAAIRGHSELAGRRSAELPADVAHALSRVNSESLRMGVLVDDLLLLARLDAGRPLAREEVDLTRLVLDVTSDAGAAERGRPGHRWRLDLPEEPVVVLGDGHRLHQVLANLLANARVHTPPGTEVTVRLSEPPRGSGPAGTASSGEVELSVTDDGPGVPSEVAEHVFERFVRADASRTRSGGTGADETETTAPTGSSGLGLAIVHAVVAAHGGTVDVESAPGRTRFRVRLPAAGAALLPVQEPAVSVAG